MATEKQKIRTPLARARGLGSAHEGSGHWLAQRMTAIANLFLMGWLAFAALTMQDWSYPAFTAWLHAPLHAVPFILTLISVCYHASLGLQVVVEDYVHCEARKFVTLIALRFYFSAVAVAGIFSILKVAFTVS